MKIEQAKELAEKALARLAENLERGHSGELKKYLAAMAKFSRYSLNNIFLILAQRPDTTRVAGYQTWCELGRQINRGARGILIFAPIVRRKAENNGHEEVSGDDGSFVKLLGFRGVHVFDRLSRDLCPGPPREPRSPGVLCHGSNYIVAQIRNVLQVGRQRVSRRLGGETRFLH